MSGVGLSATCACGHMACYHPTDAQQSMRLAASDGQIAGECKGGTSAHCRCITSREQVIADRAPTPDAKTKPEEAST